MMGEVFERELMQAIVRQFFENPPLYGTDVTGAPVMISGRTTPIQLVAGEVLSRNNKELLQKIVEKIDLDSVAQDIATRVSDVLTSPTRIGYYGQEQIDDKIRKTLRERVDNRLVELIAQDTWAKMQEEKA